MKRYVVIYGDYLYKIAKEHGTTVSAIWNDRANAQHRAKRGSPDVLYPDDVLWIPVAPSKPPPLQPPIPAGITPPSLPTFPQPRVVPVAPGGKTNTVTVPRFVATVSHDSVFTAFGIVDCARAALARLQSAPEPAKAWMADFLNPIGTHEIGVQRDLVSVAENAPWFAELPFWYRMAVTALVAADVHFTSGDLIDVGFQSFVIRSGFEGMDVPHRDGVKDGAVALVPDDVPFEGLLLGLTTPATDADFPGEFQTRMRPQLAANKKGKRFASQNSVWLMSSASKPRLKGGEVSVKPRSETVGVSFFHELAVHAFFRLVKAPPEVDRHGPDAFADQLADHLDAAMKSETSDALLTRLVEEAGAP